MTKKAIFSVNTAVPTTDIRRISYGSNQTLLDADIILFTPHLAVPTTDQIVEVRPRLNHRTSLEAKQARSHWKEEIVTAVNNGKLVIVYLSHPKLAELTDVDGFFDGEIRSYDTVPCVTRHFAVTGKRMKVTSAASVIASYWDEFSHISTYRVAIEGNFSDVLLQSQSADRTVGAITKSETNGAILFLPEVNFKNENMYVEATDAWTDAGLRAGKRLVSVLSTLVDTLAASGELTPAPDWTSGGKYWISAETKIECELDQIDSELTRLQKRKSDLQQDLLAAAMPRRLLFEKGKSLEKVVLESLRAMGYQATGYDDGELEFDAVFSSPEGKRFIGEAEGRDSKAINIEKFSQLERKLNEDLSREEVDEYAKGILFGNAYRLLKPEDRAEVFTDKCLKAAKRTGYALIRTPDMFSPTRYLREHPEDSAYAEACRTAIWNTVGGVVEFPVPPPAAKE